MPEGENHASYKKRFPAHHKRKHRREQKLAAQGVAPAPAAEPLNGQPVDPGINMIIDWADGVLAEMEQSGWGHRKRHVKSRARALGYRQDEQNRPIAEVVPTKAYSTGTLGVDAASSSAELPPRAKSSLDDPFLARLQAVEKLPPQRPKLAPARVMTPINATGAGGGW